MKNSEYVSFFHLKDEAMLYKRELLADQFHNTFRNVTGEMSF